MRGSVTASGLAGLGGGPLWLCLKRQGEAAEPIPVCACVSLGRWMAPLDVGGNEACHAVSRRMMPGSAPASCLTCAAMLPPSPHAHTQLIHRTLSSLIPLTPAALGRLVLSHSYLLQEDPMQLTSKVSCTRCRVTGSSQQCS